MIGRVEKVDCLTDRSIPVGDSTMTNSLLRTDSISSCDSGKGHESQPSRFLFNVAYE
eukprot:UN08348